MAANPIGDTGNELLLRGAALALIVALVLAWCLLGIGLEVPGFGVIFSGKYSRVLQAHLDFLIMSALILGFYGARVPLAAPVRWAMVIGAFTNSSLFLAMAIFPALDPTSMPRQHGALQDFFLVCNFASFIITSFGFGRGAVIVFRSTWPRRASQA